MSDYKSLVIVSGTTQQITSTDSLIVGVGIKAATGTALALGITGDTVSIPGNLAVTGTTSLAGTVTTVGGTVFTTDATFQGNVTFGNGVGTDTVTFFTGTTITSDIDFGGAPGTYKITNLANGTDPNDAVNYSQLSAIVSGVSSFQTSLSGLTPSSSTGGAITLAGTLGVASGGTGATSLTSGSLLAGNGAGTVAEIAPGSNGQVLTVVLGAWAAAAPAAGATAQGGANAIQYANAAIPTDFDGNANFVYDEATGFMGVGLAGPSEVLSVNGRVAIAETTVPTTNTPGYGKLWADTAAKTLHFYDNSIDYLVTPNTVATLVVTPVVLPSTFDTTTLDFAPNLPPIKTVALTTTGGRSGNLEFATSNLLASRNISVRVEGDTVSRNLLFPAWTWLGGTTPTVLPANQTAILSLAAFGGADTDVVASWSVDANTVVTSVTASLPLASSGGTTPNLSITAGTASGELLTWNGSAWVAAAPATGGTVTSVTLAASTTGLTISGAASQTITSSGTFTLGGTLAVGNGGTGTSTAFTPGSVVFAGASGVYAQNNANLFWDNTGTGRLGIGIALPTASLHVAGTVLAKNATDSTAAFDVQNAAAASQLRVDTTNSKLFFAGVATTNTHTFNIGLGNVPTDPAFAVASGGKIHYYGGSAVAVDEILIGAAGNFDKKTLTAGTGISITNGVSSVTIAATGAAAPVIDLTTTGLTAGDVAFVTTTNGTAGAADATSTATGPRAAGFVSVVGGVGVGKVQVGNVYAAANFISLLTLVCGQPVYVSKTAGKLTNDVSAFVAGNVVAEVGIITKVTTAGGGAAAADVLWQPKSIVVL